MNIGKSASRLRHVGGRSTTRTRVNNRFYNRSLFITAPQQTNFRYYWLFGGAFVASSYITLTQTESAEAVLCCNSKKEVDYEAVRDDIINILNNETYDDGSYGPVLVRLAWHASGTFDKSTCTGGSSGSTMRFSPEAHHGANAGLQVARDLLEPLKQKYPNLSYADLWVFAGCVAIEQMGGPKIGFRSGRSDAPNESHCPPDGRLPDAAQGAQHVRDIFYRMGFNDQEITALVGAHAVGRCHTDRSGFDGPWTNSPTVFSNDFYVQLLEKKWTKRRWDGPVQYEDETKSLMMLPADLAFRDDEAFRVWAEIYAKDEEKFFTDFAAAFQKLTELGLSCPKSCHVGGGNGGCEKPWWQFW